MFSIEEIRELHSRVRSLADIPGYLQRIKELGVMSFELWVVDGHTDFFGNNYTLSSDPVYLPLSISDSCDRLNFVDDLAMHNAGMTNYKAFSDQCAKRGIEKWSVNLQTMKCNYFNKSGELVLADDLPN